MNGTEESVFAEALAKQDPRDRAAFLEQACADNPSLRQNVESLLSAYEAGEFLEIPALAVLGKGGKVAAEGPGTLIGRYKLIEQIGEGGFGIVFMAEQREPVRRKVAIKILKPGMDSKQVLARFEAERQALALMAHPNIAQILDAGETATGRPFVVIELVKGIPITAYCDQAKVPTRQRLQLFRDLCQAVQHAHQKGVIHRDLKPSNVLITLHDGTPVVKVIDFGIAKAISQPLTEHTLVTGFAQMIGTPMYMSPEQAALSGIDVDTRSDVYSLGVLLYELLTGTTPFDKETLAKAGHDELRRILREDEPPRPSTRIVAFDAALLSTVSEQRGIEPRAFSEQMRGELDWIVLKALEKNRDLRYQSATAFAADVQAYLDDESVAACPPSIGYRLNKYARRYQAVLVTSGVVAAALLVGTVVSVWQAVEANNSRRLANERLFLADERLEKEKQARGETEEQRLLAEINFGKAREAIQQMLTRVAGQQLSKASPIQMRRQLLEDAVAFYTQLLRLNPRDAQSYSERGQVYRLLEKSDRMLADFEKALELSPERPEYHTQLIWGLQLSDRPQDHERALALAERAVEWQPDHALCRCYLAEAYKECGENSKARAELQRALEGGPHSAETHWMLTVVYTGLSEPTKALPHARKACELAPSNPRYVRWLVQALTNVGKDDEAIAVANKGAQQAVQSKDILSQHDYDLGRSSLFCMRGNIYLRKKKYAEAIQDFDWMIELRPPVSQFYRMRAEPHFHLKNYRQVLADLTKAVELNPRDFSILTWISPAAVAKCPDVRLRDGLIVLAEKTIQATNGAAGAHAVIASLHGAFGTPDKAQAHFKKALDLIRKEPASQIEIAPWYYCALQSLKTGDLPAYRQTCADMIKQFVVSKEYRDLRLVAWTCALAPEAVYPAVEELARRALRGQHFVLTPDNCFSLNALGAVLYRSGQFEEALEQLTAAVNAPATDTSASYPQYYFLAMTHHQLGHRDKAREWFDKAAQVTNKMLSEDQTETTKHVTWNCQPTLEQLRAEALLLHAEAKALLGIVEKTEANCKK